MWGAPGDVPEVRPLGQDGARLCEAVWIIFWKMMGSDWRVLSRVL